jgi:hypothetical protein
MGFDDLPEDWPDRSLADPLLAADVLDLVVSHRDRSEGALAVLMCDDDDRLVTPLIVSDVDPRADEADRVQALSVITRSMRGRGSILVAVTRPDGLSIVADDQVWARAASTAAAGWAVRLLGVHVVTRAGSRVVPAGMAA